MSKRQRSAAATASPSSTKRTAKAPHTVAAQRAALGRPSTTAAKALQDLSPRALYRANPVDRIGLARAGVKASKVARAASLLRLPKEQLIKTLGFSRATVARKVSDGTALDQEQSSRLVGILALVGQIEDAMDDAIDATDAGFDAGSWVSAWLDRPLPALGQRKPSEFMDSTEGQMLVSRILAQTLAGAYV